MPATEEAFDSWVQEVGSEESAAEARWEENFVKLVPRTYLDTKILELKDTVHAMTDIKDSAGTILVAKYAVLNKEVWMRLRSRNDAPEIYFVCEKPLRVVEQFNLEFFNYEDYQYLGAYFAEKGKQRSAGMLFKEAIRSETADAYINKGIYHYRSGSTGVFNNFRLAKKDLEKGLGLLRRMNFPPAEEKSRRKACQDAMEEIDFQAAGALVKLMKSIFRASTLRFERDIFYVGAADRKNMRSTETLNLMVDAIATYELQMLRESTENFIYSLKLDVPPDGDRLALALDGLANQVRAARTEGEIVEQAGQIGQIRTQVTGMISEKKQAREEAKREAGVSILDRLSTEENAQIKRMESIYALKSPRELADMAERRDSQRPLILWLYKERSHIKMIMEVLYQNPAVPEDLKKEMERRFGFGAKSNQI